MINNYMNKSYTYIISHRSTGEFYYGSRGANTVPPEDDLWKKYFSSSKIINERRHTEGNDAFDAIVLEEFDTPEDAFVSEQHLIKNHIDNPLCLNRQYRDGTEGVFLTTGTKRSTSEETRKKISETLRSGAHKSYERTEEHIAILSENGKKTGGWNKGLSYKHTKPSPLKGRVSTFKGKSHPKTPCPHCGKLIGGSGSHNLNKHIAAYHSS